MKLEQRLTKLEKQYQPSDEPITIIIRALVAADEGKPREPQPEVIGAGTMGGDWHLSRIPSESVEDFTERAKESVPRNKGGLVPVILLEYAN
ncbi:hypothetical protein [Propionivibrio sp.]|uniref:hypothetical protein n=1 Tax=Propionivibrio sp. TaxID=2212460 RepID=UPI00272EA8FB|nr:hypothetical protein [Propionivibrio sp.]